MSIWSRLGNVFRGDGLSREIEEELESHVAEAIEQGRDPVEARRALGAALQRREDSRDIRLIPWLDSLRADIVFGWRQIAKNKVTSAAAILSLALAIGACTGAFRLIDALLLRPLPVANAERLYTLARQGVDFDGEVRTGDSFAYPSFQLMRAAAKDQAELLAVAYAGRTDVAYKTANEPEKACLQYVSGWMFGSFGLRPAAGRLLTENDDRKPGASPYAVLSQDYWARRFGKDPKAVGRTFRMGERLYEIVGVVDGPFTGTEPGTVTDIFLPATMHPGATHDDWTWMRAFALVKPGVAIEPLRAKLHATSRAFEEERAKGFKGMTKESIVAFLSQTLVLQPAAAGASGLQQDYRPALMALAVLVALVLLIACANVANLLTAQATARAREMALRISIGAGRRRLVQLVLIESAILAVLAGAAGAAFAWWSAPFVVSRINPPDNPARLFLSTDWRVTGFGVALTLFVMLSFGLIPALRASSVKPVSALKGGDDPHSRRRTMHVLIGGQVAFCFLVLTVAGMFAATFNRLSHRPVGFSADRLLTVDVVAQHEVAPAYWDQMARHLGALPGVESVGFSSWPLLNGNDWNGFVSVNGAPPGPVLAHFLSVSPGWANAMKIRSIDGRDFRETDTSPGEAMVNEAFVKQFLNGERPLGKLFAKGDDHYRVVGVLEDAPYRSIREPMLPVAFVPIHSTDSAGVLRPIQDVTFLVRTAGANPLGMAATLRREVPRAQAGFRVSNIVPQADFILAQTVRERLLAMLGSFFALVALLLASVGLYGVLDYSVLQRRREIGIRMAVGAQAGDVARRVTAEVFTMVIVGALAGLGLGLGSERYLHDLLYQVQPTELTILAVPAVTILAASLLAAVLPVIRAVRIDPARMLRAE